MADASYKRSYKAAIDELSKLMEQFEDLEGQMEALRERMATVRKGVHGLAALCGANPEKEYPHLFPRTISADIGFTDAIREVFKSGDVHEYYSPVRMRDELKKRGFDLSKYKNPLASIHTILKRLHFNEEVKMSTSSDGGISYYWNLSKGEEGDDVIPF